MTDIKALARDAAEAAKVLSMLTTEQKNQALEKMADALLNSQEQILAVNRDEVARAEKTGLEASFIDRLTLTEQRIQEMVDGIRQIAQLPDPVGSSRTLDNPPSGIEVKKVRVPLGVICMIYEARPNVTADASALCFKSGNAIILRGGKEALDTSLVIAKVLQEELASLDLPSAAVTVIPDPDRELMMELIHQDDLIDLVIPRGGEGLIRFVTDNSKIPVIQHFKGVCHLYVDKDADLNMAEQLLINGKTQRTGVCNALECVLVHKDVAEEFLPKVAQMAADKQVKINACKNAVKYFDGATELRDDEFGEEYLSLELAVRVVDDFDAAIAHIDQFGSQHTEVICTANEQTAEHFQKRVDASVVMANASSRFSDGGQLGLGAEIGIATTKLHAYGPMGLESLTTEKFVVKGQGQVRQ
ncbi:glutamate-5-semialdehyde dehydrogenase [Pleionea litopenaei]|uniref:Gamma-glutamyl phosphate reductase n=1 Tax=Pleionea litopenaei TaxID=3070815 RepID=A0AA51RQD3_9GAMM|nr:glutamate-5-semialdehyde dehydrogenase [Pleionea sp. HL-JVS1]WMS85665.1 glutamate-5-semialdehyde dehydrogenase [Pleionea sp. HL-JVS1]